MDHVQQISFRWLENCGKNLRQNNRPTAQTTVCWLQETLPLSFISWEYYKMLLRIWCLTTFVELRTWRGLPMTCFSHNGPFLCIRVVTFHSLHIMVSTWSSKRVDLLVIHAYTEAAPHRFHVPRCNPLVQLAVKYLCGL